MRLPVTVFSVDAASGVARQSPHQFHVEARTLDGCSAAVRARLGLAGRKIRSINATSAGVTVYVEVAR